MGQSIIGSVVALLKADAVGFTEGIGAAKKSLKTFGSDVQSIGGMALSGLNASMMNVRAGTRVLSMGVGGLSVFLAAARGDVVAFGEAMKGLPMGLGHVSSEIIGLINAMAGYDRAIKNVKVEIAAMKEEGRGLDLGTKLGQETALIGLTGPNRERAMLGQKMTGIFGQAGESEYAWARAQEYEFAMYRDIGKRENAEMNAAAGAAYTERIRVHDEGVRKLVAELEADEKAMAEMQWRIWSDAEDYGIALQEQAFEKQMTDAAEADADMKDLLARRAEILGAPEGLERLNVGQAAVTTDRMRLMGLAGDTPALRLSKSQLDELKQIRTKLDKYLATVGTLG